MVCDPTEEVKGLAYALVEGLGITIHDGVPEDNDFPYASLGPFSSRESTIGAFITGQIDLFDDRPTSKPIGALKAQVINALPTLEGDTAGTYTIIHIRHLPSPILRESEGPTQGDRVWHAAIRFEADVHSAAFA